MIDPFDSPYRPLQRIKTQDRVAAPSPIISSTQISDEKLQDIVQQIKPIQKAIEFPLSLKELSQDYEIELIQSALENCQYNQKKTADALELTYHQLRGYLKKYNLLDTNSLENSMEEG